MHTKSTQEMNGAGWTSPPKTTFLLVHEAKKIPDTLRPPRATQKEQTKKIDETPQKEARDAAAMFILNISI